MCRFIETILLDNGKMPLIHWHEERFAQTQRAHYGKIIYPSLEDIVRHTNITQEKQIRYKCRVVYDSTDVKVEFSVYQRKAINKLIIKTDNEIGPKL